MKNSVGKIVSINKDLYSVREGESVFSLSVRGKLKNIKLTVGDNVEFNKDTLTIEKALDRKNNLERPLVSNIDELFIVVSSHLPKFSTYLIDKFLVLSEVNKIKPVLIITKFDLCTKEEKREIRNVLKYYKSIGYKIFTNKNIFKIKREMKGKVIALAGQTGAGKSTLLNKIDKSLNLKTGEVSEALGRGKHTTRLTELLYTNKALIADTPGFSSLELSLTKEEIRDAFVEFGFKCKYKTCMHNNKNGCEVIKRVEEGKILRDRYDNYIKLVSEVKNETKW